MLDDNFPLLLDEDNNLIIMIDGVYFKDKKVYTTKGAVKTSKIKNKDKYKYKYKMSIVNDKCFKGIFLRSEYKAYLCYLISKTLSLNCYDLFLNLHLINNEVGRTNANYTSYRSDLVAEYKDIIIIIIRKICEKNS